MRISHRQDQGIRFASSHTRYGIFLFSSFLLFSSFFLFPARFGRTPVPTAAREEHCVEPIYLYGFDSNIFHIEEGKILRNDYLGKILSNCGIPGDLIHQLSTHAKDIFSVNKLQAGKKFALVSEEPCGKPDYFIYEPNPWSFVVYELGDKPEAKVVQRPIITRTHFKEGHIESSLWNAMSDQGSTLQLISLMEEALGSQVDFYHVQQGDSFRLIYETRAVEGEIVDIGKLSAAYFKNENKEYYAIYYETDKHKGFFDLKGAPTKKSFLKSPVEIGYISSRFNPSRLHPILKYRRPHLGTDYAARHGSPIRAVANGTISEAQRKGGNGLYVKIRHDKMYETQYLHMSKLGSNIRPGTRVNQGQTIGYVGQSGLATGPHVCFRFWKNGKQINHLRENFPDPDPMPKEDLPAFFQWRDKITDQLRSGNSLDAQNHPDFTDYPRPIPLIKS